MNTHEVIEAINRALNLNLSPDTTPTDASLKSIGIDSLDVFNVLLELENMTGKKVPDTDVETLKTVQRLADYFST